MSSASRHFSRWRTCSGMPASARRACIAAALVESVAVVSSQDAGQNKRQFDASDAVSVTICTLTPIWQLQVLPRVPEYCRATHGEAVTSLPYTVAAPSIATG